MTVILFQLVNPVFNVVLPQVINIVFPALPALPF